MLFQRMSKPNYNLAERIAIDTIKTFNISSLPVNLFDIRNKFENLRIRSYSWFASKRSLSIKEVIEFAESESGCCWYMPDTDRYLILYNDMINNKGHIRWTIAHELGHYLLKHNEKSNRAIISRNSLTTPEYNCFEAEANCFAREFLAPPNILCAIKKIDYYEIETICNVSSSAALNIFKFIQYGMSFGRTFTEHPEILDRFHNFIHQKQCSICHHEFIIANAKYCPVCGNNNIEFGKDEKLMQYKTYPYYPEGKVQQCIRCENQDITFDHEFCMFCGVKTTNMCYGKWTPTSNCGDGYFDETTSCNHTLPPNARFCPYCGGISEYFFNNILKSWEDEYNEINQGSKNLPPINLL